MRRAALYGGVLTLCAARALVAASGKAPWPFSPYAMYSNHAAARISRGVPFVALEENGLPACRLPVKSFGAAGRLDLTGHLAARRGDALDFSTRNLCLSAGLGGERCARARFAYYLAWLPPEPDGTFGAQRFERRADDVEAKHVQAGIPDFGALFPGGVCRPGA